MSKGALQVEESFQGLMLLHNSNRPQIPPASDKAICNLQDAGRVTQPCSIEAQSRLSTWMAISSFFLLLCAVALYRLYASRVTFTPCLNTLSMSMSIRSAWELSFASLKHLQDAVSKGQRNETRKVPHSRPCCLWETVHFPSANSQDIWKRNCGPTPCVTFKSLSFRWPSFGPELLRSLLLNSERFKDLTRMRPIRCPAIRRRLLTPTRHDLITGTWFA